MMNTANNAATNIESNRKRLALSRRQLADRAGVSQQTIWLIESGRRSPTLTTLDKIARALGVEIVDLLGD